MGSMGWTSIVVDREGRLGSKGAEGAREGQQSMSSAQAGLLFQPTTPGLIRCNDFKDAIKADAQRGGEQED
jgi:hypothetical protein